MSTSPRVIEFVVNKAPVAKGNTKRAFVSPKTGRAFVVASNKTKSAEGQLAGLVAQHAPTEPWTGPIRLDVVFVIGIAKSWPNWRQKAARAGLLWPAKRPDRGNLLKMIEDVLEGPFYVDDKQVVCGEVTKVYGDFPGYRVRLEDLVEAKSPTLIRMEARAGSSSA